jgi:hypothetical protein
MKLDKLTLEGVRIIYKNFAGEKRQYNSEGDRNFSVVLEDLPFAESLIELGWNFKPVRDEDLTTVGYHLKCKVSYDVAPPRITTIRESGRLALDEKSVAMLDYQPIIEVDIVISPYHWEMNGSTGVSAYVSNMFVIIDEDRLDLKYSRVPIIGAIDTAE